MLDVSDERSVEVTIVPRRPYTERFRPFMTGFAVRVEDVDDPEQFVISDAVTVEGGFMQAPCDLTTPRAQCCSGPAEAARGSRLSKSWPLRPLDRRRVELQPNWLLCMPNTAITCESIVIHTRRSGGGSRGSDVTRGDRQILAAAPRRQLVRVLASQAFPLGWCAQVWPGTRCTGNAWTSLRRTAVLLGRTIPARVVQATVAGWRRCFALRERLTGVLWASVRGWVIVPSRTRSR
jgi:hypothetical protein